MIFAALRDQCCQWGSDSDDAAASGRLSNAVTVQQFAAVLLASKVRSEFAALFVGHWSSSQLEQRNPHRVRTVG